MKKNNYYLLADYGRVKIVALTEHYVGFIVQNTTIANPNNPVIYSTKGNFSERLLSDLGPNPEYSPDEANKPF